MNIKPLSIDNKTREQIDNLARVTRKPKETVLREVVETGLKSYPLPSSKSVQAVLDLVAWAEEQNVTGQVKDLSTNHNKYAWEDEQATDHC
jgi:hypothetical protein